MLETGNCIVAETFHSFPLETKSCLNAIKFQLKVVVQNASCSVSCMAVEHLALLSTTLSRQKEE